MRLWATHAEQQLTRYWLDALFADVQESAAHGFSTGDLLNRNPATAVSLDTSSIPHWGWRLADNTDHLLFMEAVCFRIDVDNFAAIHRAPWQMLETAHGKGVAGDKLWLGASGAPIADPVWAPGSGVIVEQEVGRVLDDNWIMYNWRTAVLV